MVQRAVSIRQEDISPLGISTYTARSMRERYLKERLKLQKGQGKDALGKQKKTVRVGDLWKEWEGERKQRSGKLNAIPHLEH